MIFSQCVRRLVGLGGNTFRSRDVDKRTVSGLMCFFGDRSNRLQLFLGVEKAFVAAGYVVIHLDAGHAAFLGVAYDFARVIAA